jgi:hypothetical protein
LKTKNKNIGSLYLQSVKNIDTIKLDKSISMFHDINNLFILFYEKLTKPYNAYDMTNNANYTNNTIYNNMLFNQTKKVFIHSNANKKTKRKQYKESII